MGGRGSSSGGSTTTMSPTQALLDYQDMGYEKLNKDLRNDKELSDKEQAELDAIESSMTTTTEDMTVYRTMGEHVGNDIMNAGPMGTITDNGLTSTTTESDLKNLDFTHGWKATIDVPSGSRVLDVNKSLGSKSQYSEEKEIILPHGGTYGVVMVNAEDKTVTLRKLN